MGDAVSRQNAIAPAQHCRQHRRRPHLGRADSRLQLPWQRLSFECNAQETLVQIQIQPLGVGPDRTSRVVRGVAFLDHPVNPAEPVDQEIVRPIGFHIGKERFTDALQSRVLLRFRNGAWGLFGGVKNDTGRGEEALAASCRPAVWRKMPDTISDGWLWRKLVIDTQPVAVRLEGVCFLHKPDFGRRFQPDCRRPREGHRRTSPGLHSRLGLAATDVDAVNTVDTTKRKIRTRDL